MDIKQQVKRKVEFISIIISLGIIYWVIDVLVDTFIFGNPFIQSLFHPGPHELWMRSVTILFLILLVYIAQTLINQKKSHKKKVNHLNLVLQAIRNVNQLITKENDEDRLIRQSCKLLTETRGYNGALIILTDDQGKFIKLEESGWKNRRKELEEQLKSEEYIECFKRALINPGVIMIEDTLKECTGCPLVKDEINNRSLTCRMEHEGKIYGLISVNLPKHFAELKEEQELVEEVAGDLAFAMHKISMGRRLLKTEKQYRLLAETARDIICIHDMEGKIQYINAAGLNALGKTLEEIRGGNIHNYILSNKELTERKQERLKGDPSEYTYQTQIQNSQGEIIPLEINSSPIEEEGKIQAILLIARDITERKQAQERIERYLTDLQIIYEVTSSLINTTNEEEILDTIGERIHTLNPSAYIMLSSLDEISETIKIERLYGFEDIEDDLREQVGADLKDISIKTTELTNENKQRLASGKFNLIEGGLYELFNKKLPEQTCRQTEDLLNVKRIYSIGFVHNGIPRGSVTVMFKEDIEFNKQTLLENIINQASVTLSQKQSEKALKREKNKAEQSDRLKSAFLMNLSHEIRTPLNGIMGFSQILQEREFPFEKQKEFLNIIHSKADQLLHILNDILDLSKIEAGQLNIRQEDFYLNDVLHEIYDAYLLELEKNDNINIALSYQCGLKREQSRMFSDRDRFRQILSNLISNAIKFTDEGSVEFGYEVKDEETLVFYVKDTGTGIPENKKEEIFEPFRQADESTNRIYEGTGLGLSISKSLVEILGGKMEFNSEEGKGSTFYFTIPYIIHKYHPEETQAASVDFPSWPEHQVLIVEDDPVSLEFMQEIFIETKMQILSAQNGAEALRIFRQNPAISLILMDLRLPDMNGLEVVQHIRAENPHVPIIAQTAYTMDNDAKKCLNAGCSDYLTKPIDIQAMLNVMNKYLKQRAE